MSLQNKQPESKELLEKYWISGKKFHTKTFSFIKKYQNKIIVISMEDTLLPNLYF